MDRERIAYVTLALTPGVGAARLATLLSACGSSVGVGAMTPGSTVSIVIEGIDTLTNKFE